MITQQRFRELARYVITGGLCVLLNVFIVMVLTEYLGLHYLVSLAFCSITTCPCRTANGCRYEASNSHCLAVRLGWKASVDWLWATAWIRPCTSVLLLVDRVAFMARR